jgi:hypothetical protein
MTPTIGRAPRRRPTTPRGPKPSGAHPHVRRVFLAATATVRVRDGGRRDRHGRLLLGERTIPTFADRRPPGPPGLADIAGRCDERACNYLLLGSDSRKGLTPEELIAFGTDAHIGGENRSDTIILVHTRPDRREVVFVSFPRDLWVDIPGMGRARSTPRSRAASTGWRAACRPDE